MPRIRYGAFALLAAMSIVFAQGCADDPDANNTTSSDVVTTGNALGHLTMAVERGKTVSSLQLEINSTDDVEVVLRDQDGKTEIPASATSGSVSLEPFMVNEGGYLSALDVFVGERLYGTLDIHLVDEIEEVPVAYSASLYGSGNGFQVIDTGVLLTSFDSDPGSSSDDGIGVARQALTCGYGIAGPGIVDFWSASPGYNGQTFSYKPEAGGALQWAINGERPADGLYRAHWGCGTALKVPNNCTEYVKQDTSLSYCCGFPSWNIPSWVDTYNDAYFDDCPLFF